MNRITDVENAIDKLGPGDFQIFCDTLLKRKKYGTMLSLGMQGGTVKTTVGNPDTYFRKENGKYVLVAYTTQKRDIYEKLKDDVDKCLDIAKTRLPVTEIEEIICCHTSSNLKAGDDFELHEYCAKMNIKLSIYGINEIAQYICNEDPILANWFLNMSLDTNQIMSVDDFVFLYDSNQMASPLKTEFIGREEELAHVLDELKNNSVVIAHGPAGNGKTRLVLEAVRKFSEREQYHALCVKNNNLELYDDLIAKTSKPGKYLFFVDDANELAGLSQIIGKISAEKEKKIIKVILTVRDYAKEEVVREVLKYEQPVTILIDKLNDDAIKKFLDSNFSITNRLFIDQIIQIAEGNPRLAYMAGKLAIESNSLASISDATQLYDQYYSAFVDKEIGANQELCVAAGILSILSAININNLDRISNILAITSISEDRFRTCVGILHQMEVVEIHKDQLAVISDQCLANYMLYYVFFKKKAIPFSEILYTGFKFYKSGVIRSINTIFNIFKNPALHENIKSEVIKTWDKYANCQDKCLYDFIKTFHTFRPDESFIIAKEKIDNVTEGEMLTCRVNFNENSFYSSDDVLELLSGYLYSPEHLKIAIQLIIEYAGKSKETAVKCFHFILQEYGIDYDSAMFGFKPLINVLNEILSYDGENLLTLRLIIAFINELLSFEFRPATTGRKNTVLLYHIELTNCADVTEYRKLCWSALLSLSKRIELTIDISNLLKKYSHSIRGAKDSEIVLNDKRYVEALLDTLAINTIQRAIILSELQYSWKKKGIDFDADNPVFNSKEWKIYRLLKDDYFKSGLDFEEYTAQRDNQLRKFAEQLKIEEIDSFIQIASENLNNEDFDDSDSGYHVENESIERILQFSCDDYEKAEKLFVSLMENGDYLDVSPRVLLHSLFKHKSFDELLHMIEIREFRNKNNWLFDFFQELPEKMVDERICNLFLEYLKNDSDKEIKSSHYRNLRLLDKFLCVNPQIYVDASHIIYSKIAYSDFVVKLYFELLFYDKVYSPNELINFYQSEISLLRKIYFFMLRNSRIDDLNGTFLLSFLNLDNEWLEEYSNQIVDAIDNSENTDSYRIESLWKAEHYIKYFDRIFEIISDNERHISPWRLAESFSILFPCTKSDSTVRKRQEEWIIHTVEKYSQSERVITLFHMLSDGNEELRKKALMYFVRLNDSYSLFEKLPLDSDYWGGTEGEIINQLTKRINFLDELNSEISGVAYLKHKKRINDRIEMWKSEIKSEELHAIYRKLYM